MIDCIKKSQCTGCQMCASICPVHAISYEVDKEGFWYPKVDKEKCINCKKCIKFCPSLNEFNFQKNAPEVYKTWIKDDNIRLSSTSGGIYYAIAKYYVEHDGYIVGSIYSDDYKSAKHFIGHTIDDLNKIMGSKYFQSSMFEIYEQVKKLLTDGKEVLFMGTPCQSVSLQKYLNKEYKNLLIMDFICRGINSPLAFSKRVDELEEKFGSKVTKVHLKNKKTGWTSLASYFEFENGKKYHVNGYKDPWVRGYIEGNLYIRESCFDCKYKSLPRNSDISVGDFWGIHNANNEDMFKGISLMMINSEKGKQIIEKIKDSIELEKRDINEALDGNPAIRKAIIRKKERDEFFKNIESMNFTSAVHKCIGKAPKRNIFTKVKNKFAQYYKKIHEISLFKFIHLNYFSKHVIRDKGCYFIPYKNAKIELSKNAKIYVKNSNINFGINKIKGSKAETYLRMSEGAIWNSNNGAGIFYNVTIEIKKDALLDTHFFTANSGSVIITAKKITIGEDVMLGRNIMVYDSDHHQILDENYNMLNQSKEVVIENHVWLTSNINVLKGTTIGKNSIVTSQSLVRKNIEEQSIAGSDSTAKRIAEAKKWSRKSTN